MTRKQQRLGLLALGMTRAWRRDGAGADRLQQQPRVLLQPERSEDAGDCGRPGGCGSAGSSSDQQRRARRRTAASFRITDGKTDVAVAYRGILPDLFREGQGVVAEGKLEPDGVFAASTVLAKHDERYMPREVVDALKKVRALARGRSDRGSRRAIETGRPRDRALG